MWMLRWVLWEPGPVIIGTWVRSLVSGKTCAECSVTHRKRLRYQHRSRCSCPAEILITTIS